jgi:hypothetical protein
MSTIQPFSEPRDRRLVNVIIAIGSLISFYVCDCGSRDEISAVDAVHLIDNMIAEGEPLTGRWDGEGTLHDAKIDPGSVVATCCDRGD